MLEWVDKPDLKSGDVSRAGSSPAVGTHASLAQLAEQGPFKPWVVGSSPTGGT